ncbi:protein maelstrom [Scaptodrosophila lebanonensis]|uniref:Protein maelstrom n=1 Tax=Drosophila lebanonensis TaxID=7225 RepID=A0A6J2UAX8_DROLE|nr:protein maelstrom [Scaptodrosophila lebanonensis]XP_030385515.1 protein maelstrom [Scaptodrosophila lebanonensis]
MPKKSNGFMQFVHEMRRTQSEFRKLSLDQSVHRCGLLWRDMNAQQRGPYNSAAKDVVVKSRCKNEPLNCIGVALSTEERLKKEAEEEILRMKRNIERMVMEGKKQNDLENTMFIFVAFNYFTKSLNSDVYLPAEFAACEYSLKSGMNSVYNTHIDPGALIFGQARDAMQHTTSTHRLPLPPSALGEANMGKLYENILEYLRTVSRKEKPLVVFTTSELIPIVKSCFRFVESGYDGPEQTIEIYDIQYLFYILKKEVMDVAGIVNNTINNFITDAEFEKDFFQYSSGIACNFHEECDRCNYCTQSMVIRWCYIFSDYMCGDLAIPMMPNKHIPPNVDFGFEVHCPEDSSAAINESMSSFYSLDSSRVKKENGHSVADTSNASSYVPRDHTSFSGSLKSQDDFPNLSSKKSNTSSQPLINSVDSFTARTPKQEPMSAWNMPPNVCGVAEDEDFVLHPRGAKPKKMSRF